MTQPTGPLAGFRLTFTIIGILYTLMAGSALLRGVGMLADFAVPNELIQSPVFEDFFLFFYELMAFIGVLMITFGNTVRELKAQTVVALVFTVANGLFGYRDLATSDSAWGNRLYRGEATLMFVVIDVILMLAFAFLAVRGLLRIRRDSASPS